MFETENRKDGVLLGKCCLTESFKEKSERLSLLKLVDGVGCVKNSNVLSFLKTIFTNY